MRSPSSANVGRPVWRRLARSGWLALAASLAVIASAAQQYRSAPKFEGKMIPEPPSQGQPWTAPETKLPKFLVTATAMLFEQGVADPRACEYRMVEIGAGSVVKVRGFVLPERADAPGRFAVCWDGQVYPAVSVGDPVDLGKDMSDLVTSMKRTRENEKSKPYRDAANFGFPGEGRNFFGGAGVDDHSPIKVCMLLRIGRADLAEALFAAGTTWTPEVRARDLTDYGISYLTLAEDWAASAFGRLILAHIRGEDVIALDSARKLVRFRDLATATADEMGFPRRERQSRRGAEPAPRFTFLTQLDELLSDQERRAKMPARNPIPKKGGDPTARIAALIRDLDRIDEHQMSSFGAARPGSSPLVRELVVEGDAAVAPLLQVLELDNRLTRSVSNGRGMSRERFVHPVYEAALDALIGILQTNEFDGYRSFGWKIIDPAARKALAGALRQFWQRTRSVPLVERWYRTLLDDSAGPGRWLEAAGGIIRPDVPHGSPWVKPGTRPMKGEQLRAGRGPSVSDLMLRRTRDIERMGDSQNSREQGFYGACRMASALALWDEKASLSVLKDLMKGCRARSDRWLDQENPANFDRSLASSLAEFTEIRVKLGDPGAFEEYADWLRTTTPTMLEYGTFDALKPLLAHPDQPALASAARWLFNDPKSPWVPLIPEARGQQPPHFQNLFASPLMVVAGFREGVLAGLAEKAPLGTVTRVDQTTIERKIKNVSPTRTSPSKLDQEGIALGVEHRFRFCDYLASMVSGLEGCPRCDLFWSEARRDEAVAACVAYLKRFGGSLTAQALPGVLDFPGPKAHLQFPILGKSATLDDVSSARAIFSLEGQGEARPAKMPGPPQRANWVTLKDSPVDRTYQDGVTRREYQTDGVVWQAEEVHNGDRWERFYGFVGQHTIARAPASEIEFVGQPGPWWNLKGGLDAAAEMVESRTTGYAPGQPIFVAVKIRNRLGVAHLSPTELIRPAPDGKPALRRGVNLLLWRSAARGANSKLNQGYPDEVVEPKRKTHFDAGDGSRQLEPLEAFESMRFDLSDWFDLTQPGKYRLRVTFAADSGLGEGAASEAYFQVGVDE
jgi:hypothetical protein